MPLLIAIAGLSGSGKTTLARKLAARLECPIIALDSYYLPQPGVPIEERARRNYDHPDALDWPLLRTHLDALLRAEAVDTPVYRFDLHTRAEASRRVEPYAFYVLEGILALGRPEIRELAHLKAFVTAAPEICLKRRIERDVLERGRTRESVMEQYNSTVWPMALEQVLPTEQYADVVVSGEGPPEESVRQVLARIRRAG